MDNYPNSIHLTVADVKKSIKFFTEKLGFTLREIYPSPKKPMWASMELDRQTVMVGASMNPDDAKQFGMTKDEVNQVKKDSKAFTRYPHGVGVSFYLGVPDVDAHFKVAKRKKVEILSAPKTQFYGLREYVAHDPDGYRFVFYTRVQAEMPEGQKPAKATGKPREEEEEAVTEA